MNDQEIFTPEEREENYERKRELIELVVSGEAVLIVGAGSSVRVDYVDWSGLLKELESLAIECGKDFEKNDKMRENAPLEYVEKIKSHIFKKKGNLKRYYAKIDDLFNTQTPFQWIHEMLVSLPFRGILTTNYDMVLEAVLVEKDPLPGPSRSLIIDEDSAGRVREFLMALIDRNMPRRIAHLHGSVDYLKSIILSRGDYEKAYGQRNSEWTLHRKLLWAVLATRRVVFIGFSMNDPYFNEMLKTVSEDLWRWGKSIHFAIMSISPDGAENSKTKATRLRKEYGVETVFYEDLDGSHQDLDDIVAEIAKACGVETPSPIVSQEQPSEITPQYGPDWLEQMNKHTERGIGGDEN